MEKDEEAISWKHMSIVQFECDCESIFNDLLEKVLLLYLDLGIYEHI